MMNFQCPLFSSREVNLVGFTNNDLLGTQDPRFSYIPSLITRLTIISFFFSPLKKVFLK